MSKQFLFCILAVVSLFLTACSEKEQEITVQSIAISQPSAELKIGETLNLKATVSPSNATYDGITWTSTKTSVATVSSSGQVSALAEGNTTITAMAGGKTASCSVTVVKGYVAVSSISLNKENLELVEGNSETLTATVSPNDATDKTVSWASSNDAVATVKDGTVSAVKEGEATITAKAGEKTASCKVVVAKKIIPVESIELNKTVLELKKGESSTLTATVLPTNATNPEVSWSSSNSDIAKVDQNGKINAIAGGEAIISAKAGDKSTECKVSVSVQATSVSLNKTSVEMHPSETIQLVATILPEDTTEKASWSSTNQGVASVDENGMVVALNEGSSIIKIAVGGIEASCSITVIAKPNDIISFADDKVKSQLVAAFDTNGDGELSYEEAAAVTSIEGVLTIPTISSFDEFQYFTGVPFVPKFCFRNYTKLSSIILPPNLEAIYSYAFEGCTSLREIIIPESVKSIGECAWSNCKNLTSISIPGSVTAINYGTFLGCSNLKEISLSKGVLSIGEYAFKECSSLTTVHIPNSVTSIESAAFYSCSSLTSIYIPKSVISFGRSVFSGCNSLSYITVDSNNEVYDSRDNCNAIIRTDSNTLLFGCKTTIIPNSIKRIGEYAFSKLSSLVSISIPENVTYMNAGAFEGCTNLINIDIKGRIPKIALWTFRGCTSLSSITLPETVTEIESSAFDGCRNLSSVILPEGLAAIWGSAFRECSSLVSITIPSGVYTMGAGVFLGCDNLTSVTVLPETPPALDVTMRLFSGFPTIYVPSASVEAYKQATGWRNYASCIQAIQE